MTGYRTLLLLAPLLFALADARAQDPADPNQPSPDTDGPAPQASGDEPASPPRGEDSPFDYQASEQISEDLSVSFPVDI